MFITNQVSPERLVELIDYCIYKRDMMEAPAWKQYIDYAVNEGMHSRLSAYQSALSPTNNGSLMVAEETVQYGSEEKFCFPFGIYFGTKVKDFAKDRIGVVVGIQPKYILVAFEDELDPRIIAAGPEFFEKGYYAIA